MKNANGKYLVSACLAGENCRYDGKNCRNERIAELVRQGRAVPVCPEQLAGLPTPRPCCEIITDEKGNLRVVSRDKSDFSREYEKGAEKTLAIAKANGVRKAILKSRSPSCGCGMIHDGTFSGRLIKGNGITARLLMDNHIQVFTEDEIDAADL